jgi:hypothetical protein
MILFLIGCKNGDDSPINDEASTINVNGIIREYIMYVPSSYDKKKLFTTYVNFSRLDDVRE